MLYECCAKLAEFWPHLSEMDLWSVSGEQARILWQDFHLLFKTIGATKLRWTKISETMSGLNTLETCLEILSWKTWEPLFFWRMRNFYKKNSLKISIIYSILVKYPTFIREMIKKICSKMSKININSLFREWLFGNTLSTNANPTYTLTYAFPLLEKNWETDLEAFPPLSLAPHLSGLTLGLNRALKKLLSFICNRIW